jgi:hypothetical protein
MNEQIKELIKQCSTTFDSYDFEFGWSTHEYFDKEKFAELIVKECATLAYDGPNGILEHFGVK